LSKKPTDIDLGNRIRELEALAKNSTASHFERLFNLSLDMLCVADISGYFRIINKSFEETLGYTQEELLEYPFTHFIHADDLTSTLDAIKQLDEGKSVINFENRYRCKDGSYKWLNWTSKPVVKEGLTYAVARDITERKRAETELKYMVTHDSLTGIYNRQALGDLLRNEIERTSRYSHVLSIFMLDIDDFKQINDTYGHLAGDAVLISFAKLLENSIRNSDSVARYGGEEFVVILPETSYIKAKELAERLYDRIANYPHSIKDKKELNITASIGIATFPEHATAWQDLLDTADSNMYEEKHSDQNPN